METAPGVWHQSGGEATLPRAQKRGLSPSLGAACLPACLRAAACLLSLTGQSSASCFINSTASLPVFTLITCWGGGGRRQGARWPTLELQASPVEERSVGLAQPQASEVGSWSLFTWSDRAPWRGQVLLGNLCRRLEHGTWGAPPSSHLGR